MLGVGGDVQRGKKKFFLDVFVLRERESLKRFTFLCWKVRKAGNCCCFHQNMSVTLHLNVALLLRVDCLHLQWEMS